jgi:hypothetical protein
MSENLKNQKPASSPERHTFQKEGYIKHCEEEGKEPNPDYVAMYKTWREQDEENLKDPAWQENNLEYDLRTTEWILEKARTRVDYAQNIYAAMCNMRWQRLDVFPILKEEYWSCSWRSAGGIVADMLQKGDYIDWYCSGIGNAELGNGLTGADGTGYVPEGVVTEEIRADFQKLGWIPSEWPDDEA